jgi:hypothetical protein
MKYILNDMKQLYFMLGFTTSSIASILLNNGLYGILVLIGFGVVIEINNIIDDYEKDPDKNNAKVFMIGGLIGEIYIIYLAKSNSMW